jgi:mannose-6-phosphate isomerase-like protein (cupin superfamily)
MAAAARCERSEDFTKHQLRDFVGGWIVGRFTPALLSREDIEVAIKHYRAGDHEPRHHHKIATEYTVIATGRVRMDQREYVAGDIIQIDPGQSTDFEALEATTTVVVKTPSVPDDKYMDAEESRRSPDA